MFKSTNDSSKIDVLLIQPSVYNREPSKLLQPPLGLAYIASFLISKGVKVAIIDAMMGNKNVDCILKDACKISPNVIGITTTCEDRFNAISLCNKIKSKLKNTLIIVGGPHFSYSAKDALINVPGIDVVVMDEGEHTSFEVVQRFLNTRDKNSFHDILGCAFRDKKGRIMMNPRRPPIKDIDGIPTPAWDLFDMNEYQGVLSTEGKTRAINVISSRGCPYRCVYCSNSLKGGVRYRNPKLFVDEIEYLHKEYGFNGVNIYDDSFTANIPHVENICKEIIKRKLKIRWYCRMRLDNVSLDLLKLIKKAGCVAIGYGVEAGSDDMLKSIKKGVTTAQIRKSIEVTAKVGFDDIALFTMTSFPGQKLKDVLISAKFVMKMQSILEGKSIYDLPIDLPTKIYPGTEIEMIALKNGNVFSKGFSWNKYYKTNKSRIFDTNPYVPHFEDPSLSLIKIRAYMLWLKLKLHILRLFRLPPEWL